MTAGEPTVIEQAAALLAQKQEEPQPPLMAVGLNREAWLTALVEKLRLHFADSGYPLGEHIYISAGWPAKGALSNKNRRIGECWASSASADGNPHIFISPILDNVPEIAETVVHELGHAVLPPGTKHGPGFKKFQQAIGLEGKPTSDHAGLDLAIRLKEITDSLGPYPHSKLSYTGKEKVQTTRMLKLTCPEHSDYILRASKKVIDQGLPMCGVEECDKRMEEAA
jgi:hypothetical protein